MANASFQSPASAGAAANAAVVGTVLILLSLPRGAVRERYGTWDR
jgi:hypothetical protein